MARLSYKSSQCLATSWLFYPDTNRRRSLTTTINSSDIHPIVYSVIDVTVCTVVKYIYTLLFTSITADYWQRCCLQELQLVTRPMKEQTFLLQGCKSWINRNHQWPWYGFLVGSRALSFSDHYYLRQVNEVNGGDNVFVRCVSLCLSVFLCVRSRPVNQTSLKWAFKAADFKFDTVPRDSWDITPKNFSKRGRCQGHVTPKFLGVKC